MLPREADTIIFGLICWIFSFLAIHTGDIYYTLVYRNEKCEAFISSKSTLKWWEKQQQQLQQLNQLHEWLFLLSLLVMVLVYGPELMFMCLCQHVNTWRHKQIASVFRRPFQLSFLKEKFYVSISIAVFCRYGSSWQSSLGLVCAEQVKSQVARFMGANMGPTWVLSAPDGPHVGTWLSGCYYLIQCAPGASFTNRYDINQYQSSVMDNELQPHESGTCIYYSSMS